MLCCSSASYMPHCSNQCRNSQKSSGLAKCRSHRLSSSLWEQLTDRCQEHHHVTWMKPVWKECCLQKEKPTLRKQKHWLAATWEVRCNAAIGVPAVSCVGVGGVGCMLARDVLREGHSWDIELCTGNCRHQEYEQTKIARLTQRMYRQKIIHVIQSTTYYYSWG